MANVYKRIGKEKEVKLLIIIVTYNAKSFITDLLKSILDQDYDLRRVLFIVDNASVEGTLDKVLRLLAKIMPQTIY